MIIQKEDFEKLMIFLLIVSGIFLLVTNLYLYYKNKNNTKQNSQIQKEESSNNNIVLRESQEVIDNTFPSVLTENTNETGPVVYFANDSFGNSDREYRFNYKKIGNSWRAYILRMPSLGGRNSEYAVTHRLNDRNGNYVCWDSQVNTLKDMQTISKVWADSIQEYIATGKTFG